MCNYKKVMQEQHTTRTCSVTQADCVVFLNGELDILTICHSVVKSFPTLRPHELQHVRFSCPHNLPGFAQTHFHWVGDAYPTISSSVTPICLLPSVFPRIRVFIILTIDVSKKLETNISRLRNLPYSLVASDIH